MTGMDFRSLHAGRRRTCAFLGLALLSLALLAGCAEPALSPPSPPTGPDLRGLRQLMPADVLILGEQHDAPEHHAIEREVVQALAGERRLAALALEMAEEGQSSTLMPPQATDAEVQAALNWNDKAWPWTAYGPAVMAAVRAGVPVVGANLPRARMREAMADVSLDAQLSEDGRRAQQAAVREGHCNLLPETQIVPMTRVQMARDRAMAQTLLKLRQPGRTVVLITGAGHATRLLGVPQYLPTDLTVRSVLLAAGDRTAPEGAYDQVWRTPALPPQDYCARVRPQPRS